MTCENCGRTIGNLETPSVYKEHVVCGDCYARLIPTATVAIPQATESAPLPETSTENDLIDMTPEARSQPAVQVHRCPDCRGAVSSSAARCPHCGRVMKSVDIFRVMILLLIVVAVLFLVAAWMPHLSPSDFSR